MKTTLQKLALLALILMIAACAGMSKTPEEILEVRSQQRWDALLSGDYETAYEYFSPGLRQTVQYQDFLRKMISRSVRWTGASVKEVVNCDEEACVVKLDVRYQVRAPAGGGLFSSTHVVSENWIRSGGQWYFVPEDVL